MTDREKLITELQELAGMLPPICDRDRPETVLIFDKPVTVYCKPFEQFQDVLRRAAEALADDGVTVQKWIPVTERLPEFDLKVLVYGGDRPVMDYGRLKKSPCVYTGRIGGLDEGWFTWDESAYIENVTHWMPLPEPPKGE